jgi:small-conductance mechanosensitive channel/CRP-like cAMP-binding protein
MTLLQNVTEYAHTLVGLFAALALLLLLTAKNERRWVLICAAFFAMAYGIAHVAYRSSGPLAEAAFATGILIAGIATASLLGILFFRVILPAAGFVPPRILQDVSVALVHLAWGIFCLQAYGVSFAGILTTSAVLTAVIGFSMQDTLGNILAGLALQTDRSIHVGDWIKIDDINGRVVETRWRYTAVETRNWETIIIPNSVLMKNRFLVLGRRGGQPVQWRRWVWFHVDFRYEPSRVLSTVTEALQKAEIQRVSKDPKPNCVLMDFAESYGRYAARYWLTDLAVDDPTDSEVRTHIYAALQREGIPLSIPAHALFVTDDSAEHRAAHVERERGEHYRALKAIGLFHALNDHELHQLAGALHEAIFAKGDVITQQGGVAHNLYILQDGVAEVLVLDDAGQSKPVAELKGGDFFGEMALLTGEPRRATVIARSQVKSYRLDKESLQGVMSSRPAIAEEISQVLAQRQTQLQAVLHNLDEESRKRRMAEAQSNLLLKIRNFFSLD